MTEQHENFPNGFEAFCLIAALFLVEVIVAAAVGDADMFSGADPLDVGGFVTVAGNGVLFCFLLAYKRMSYRALFHSAQHSVAATVTTLSIPIVLTVPGLALAAGLLNSVVLGLFPMSQPEQEMFEQMLSSSAVSMLFTCMLAPVLEEMLFRGVILRSFLHQYSRLAAITGSSILFGIAHLNVYQLATAFVIGVVAGWLYERSRSLWPCIVLHAAYNSFVAYIYATMAGDVEDAAITSVWFLGASIAAAVLGGVLLLLLLAPATRKPG